MGEQSMKKILYMEDLVSFCESNKFTSFSSKNSGYQLCVQVPAEFKKDDIEEDDGLLMRVKMRLFHIGINRNKSSVTEEAAKKAMKHLAYKPILANFCETGEFDDDGNPIMDFTSHDMIETDSGTKYIERQIGCITADEPWLEYDEDLDKTFICAYGVIPKEYSESCKIIERKGGTKTSVELLINEMQYSAKNKVLELTDVMVQGETCLGIDPDTKEEVGEGMLGSRADIADFSATNNSVLNYSSTDNKIIEALDKLANKIDSLSNFNINNQAEAEDKNQRKEDEDVENENTIEVKEEVTETEEVEVTETDESTEEVTETAENESEETVEAPEVVEEMAEESNESDAETKTEETEVEVAEENEEVQEDSEVKENEACGGSGSGSSNKRKKVKHSIEFEDGTVQSFEREVSLREQIGILEELVNIAYAEADNCYYCVEAYDDFVVMIDYWTGKAYKQSYSTDNDAYALTGDRVEVFATYITEEEQKALDEMKSNYSALEQFKADTENAQLHSQREAILSDEKYAIIAEKETDAEGNEKFKNESYAQLVSEMDNYSLTDLEKEVKSVFADYITTGGQFALKTEPETKTTVAKKIFASSTKKTPSRYGNLFSNK